MLQLFLQPAFLRSFLETAEEHSLIYTPALRSALWRLFIRGRSLPVLFEEAARVSASLSRRGGGPLFWPNGWLFEAFLDEFWPEFALSGWSKPLRELLRFNSISLCIHFSECFFSPPKLICFFYSYPYSLETDPSRLQHFFSDASFPFAPARPGPASLAVAGHVLISHFLTVLRGQLKQIYSHGRTRSPWPRLLLGIAWRSFQALLLRSPISKINFS